MSIQSILAEHDPQVLFDAKLTPSEAAMAAQNLIQAALYTNEEIRDAYVQDEVHYLKQVASECNTDSEQCLEAMGVQSEAELYGVD